MIRLLILPLLLIVAGCGYKNFESAKAQMKDGTTLHFEGVWAETLSQGISANTIYRCGSGDKAEGEYTVIETTGLGDRVVVERVTGCTEVDSSISTHRSLWAGVAEGIAYSVPGAVADIWSSNNIKKGLRESGDNINNTLEGGNASAAGGEAYAEGGQGGAGGAGGSAVVSVVNDVSQSQGQGQLQGQTQGQASHNNNSNYNVNKPTANASATATSAPHINNKPTFNNNNKPVNVNVNKPTNTFKPTNYNKPTNINVVKPVQLNGGKKKHH